MISVIMPVYNGEKYLREAIDSILSQTYSDFEFIIINDCSTDSTEEIILSYSDNRIVYIKNEKNMGVAATLNRGLDIAKGEYIARMDADDISLPKRFEKQIGFMEKHKNVAVCGTWVEFFGAANSVFKNPISKEETKVSLLFNSCIAHPTAMIRTNIAQCYKYDSEYEGLEDYELWYRISLEYDITNIPDVLLKYRIHKEQVTQNYTECFFAKVYNFKKRILHNLDIVFNSDELKAYIEYSLGMEKDKTESGALTSILNKLYMSCSHNGYSTKILKKVFKGIIIDGYEHDMEAIFIRKTDVLIYSIKNKLRYIMR